MSVLHDRIRTQGGNPDRHPVGTGATPMVMPMDAISHEVVGADHVVYYEQLTPLITADGAVIPARSGGRHADVIPAGQA